MGLRGKGTWEGLGEGEGGGNDVIILTKLKNN